MVCVVFKFVDLKKLFFFFGMPKILKKETKLQILRCYKHLNNVNGGREEKRKIISSIMDIFNVSNKVNHCFYIHILRF